MPKTLIHIGYHKTASTWLQEELFSSEVFDLVASKEEIRDQIILPGPFAETKLECTSTDKVAVISSERLSGSPFSGGYDTKLIADRLYQQNPEAKILIIVRDQVEMIHSCYLQHIRVGGSFSLEDFLNPPQRFRGVVPSFSFEYFRYIELIDYYTELWGKDNVLVLDYSLFQQEPQKFCKEICDLVEVSVPSNLNYSRVSNPKLGYFGTKFAQQLNKFCSRSAFNPHAWDLDNWRKVYRMLLAKWDALMPQALHQAWYKSNKKIISEAIAGRYDDSNAKLQALINKQGALVS